MKFGVQRGKQLVIGLISLGVLTLPSIAQDEFGGFPEIEPTKRLNYTNCELAELTFEKNDYFNTILLLTDCLEQHMPAAKRAHYLGVRGGAYLVLLLGEPALKDFDEILELGFESMNQQAGRGEALNLLGRHVEAVETFKAVMSKDPGDPRGPTGLGVAHYSLDNFDLAMVFLDLAVETNPSYVRAYMTRGTIRFRNQQFRQAVDNFTAVIALSPHNEEAFYLRGLARSRLSQYEEALADLTEAHSLDPDDEEIQLDRAIVLARVGRADEAQQELNVIVDKAPNNSRALMTRGRLYVALGMTENAIKDFNQALAIDPNGDHAEEAMKIITLLKE